MALVILGGNVADEQDNNKKNKDKYKKTVDVDLSQLLGGNLSKLVDMAASLSQEGETIAERLKNLDGVSKTREFTDDEGRSGVIGFRIRTGLGGETNVDTFGNVYGGEGKVSDIREPLTDIYDRGDHLSIITEMPGVAEDAVAITFKGMTLTIDATGRNDQRYQKHIVLPDHAKTDTVRKHYQNGILELTIPLQDASQH
jgi:HSP20 family molecular chaperone IbpA